MSKKEIIVNNDENTPPLLKKPYDHKVAHPFRDKAKRKEIKELPDHQPWEQLENENDLSFQCFQAYREMGPDRTVTGLSRIIKVHEATLYSLMKKFKWRQRNYEYQVHLDRKIQKAKEKDIEEMFKRHSHHSQAVESALMVPVTTFIKKIREAPQNELENMTLKELLTFVYSSADRLPKIVDTERKSRGVPTDIAKMNVDHTSKGEHIGDSNWNSFKSNLENEINNEPTLKEPILKLLDKISLDNEECKPN